MKPNDAPSFRRVPFDQRVMRMKKVVSHRILGTSKRGGARFKLDLECGHVEYRILSSVYDTAPKRAKCKQCV